MLIVNYQKVKELKKINRNKIIESLTKNNVHKSEQAKNSEKSTVLNNQKIKLDLNLLDKDIYIPIIEKLDKQIINHKNLERNEDDVDNVLTKLMKKIGSNRKKQFSPKGQIEIEFSMNKINKIKEKIKNNAESKLHKYGYIKKRNGIEESKIIEKMNNNLLKIETLNFNILKYQESADCDKEIKETILPLEKSADIKPLINSKTLVAPINTNPNPHLFAKVSVNKTLNPILQENNRLKIELDTLPTKKTKLLIENRLNEKSPHAHKGRIGYEYSISPSKGSSPERIQIKYFTYVIRKGNNYDLMKRCFTHRSNWKELSAPMSTGYNYKWQETKKRIEYVLLNKNVMNHTQTKMVNHFEYDPEISNKKYMFINFLLYCDKNNMNVFDFTPLTIILKYNSPNFPKNMKSFSNIFKNISNYIPGSKFQTPNYSDYFIIDGFESPKNTDIIINKTNYKDKNLWILKPSDLCGGRCIYISNNLEEIEKLTKNYFDGMVKSLKKVAETNDNQSDSDEGSEEEDDTKIRKYRTSTIIIQKYIEDPLLYKGRKFDIRMWVLLDHNMQVYLFKEGHLKTASVDYDLSTNDKFVHITNYSLQKYNNNFNKHEFGNEVSFKDFQEFLNTEYQGKDIDIKRDMYPKMIEIIKLTTNSVKDKINRKNRKFCYVVLGYDFMIDINFKIWLIEINKNPGLSFSSPIIEMLLPRMMDDSFRLTIDKVFEPSYNNNEKNNYKSPYPVEGYDDYENMWMLIENEIEIRENNL